MRTRSRYVKSGFVPDFILVSVSISSYFDEKSTLSPSKKDGAKVPELT